MKNLCLLVAFCLVCVTAASEDICNEEEFKCSDDSCIPGNWSCDGDDDCTDGEDEAECEAAAVASCSPDGYFSCGDGECTPPYWHCDGAADCTNGADERNCEGN